MFDRKKHDGNNFYESTSLKLELYTVYLRTSNLIMRFDYIYLSHEVASGSDII